VTRPANQLSKVVLFKSDVSNSEEIVAEEKTVEVEEVLEQAEESVEKGYGMGMKMKKKKEMPAFIKEKMKEKEMEKEEMEEEEEEEMPMKKKGKMKKDDDDSVEIPSEVYDYIETLESANAELVDAIEKMAKEQQDEQDEILKSADPRLVEIVKGLEERASAAETIAKAERDHRLVQEYIAKASTLSNLPIKAEEFGSVLKNVAEALTEEQFSAIWQVLNAANSNLSKAGLFNEIGKSSTPDNDGPLANIEKVATALRQANPLLTREQSIAKAVETDANLYKQYIREVGK
jgi:myosin heavy subunit